MPASRRAKPTRKADEFKIKRLIARLESLRANAGAYSWSLSEIQSARDAQMAGDFKLPARLAESFRTDDAMFTAHRTRLAPQRAIPVKMKPPRQSAAALRICGESEALFGQDGVGAQPETFVTINSHLANHGLAFGTNIVTPRADGSRIDLEHHVWPIEWVRWDSLTQGFVTQVDPKSNSDTATEWLSGPNARHLHQGVRPIVHGDGRWTIYAAQELDPWKDCCVLPGALVWARHAFGLRDWLNSSAAHGNPKLVGELPANTKTKSQEGDDFLALLIAIASADMPVGLRPHGSTIEYVTNTSRAWEIFKELATTSKVSAAQIYNGHDGTLGTSPNGPGIDLTALLGVMSDIAEGDLHTIERRFKTGVIDVWCALNFGSSADAPKREYQIPDADQDDKRARAGERRTAFYDAIAKERELGFNVTAERIKVLAEEYDVTAAELAPAESAAPSIQLAPTDIAKVLKVDEARAAGGAPPLTLPDGSPDPDGKTPFAAYVAKLEAAIKSADQPAPGLAPAARPPSATNGAPAAPAAPPVAPPPPQ